MLAQEPAPPPGLGPLLGGEPPQRLVVWVDVFSPSSKWPNVWGSVFSCLVFWVVYLLMTLSLSLYIITPGKMCVQMTMFGNMFGACYVKSQLHIWRPRWITHFTPSKDGFITKHFINNMARKEEQCSAQALQPPLEKLMMPMMMKV